MLLTDRRLLLRLHRPPPNSSRARIVPVSVVRFSPGSASSLLTLSFTRRRALVRLRQKATKRQITQKPTTQKG